MTTRSPSAALAATMPRVHLVVGQTKIALRKRLALADALTSRLGQQMDVHRLALHQPVCELLAMARNWSGWPASDRIGIRRVLGGWIGPASPQSAPRADDDVVQRVALERLPARRTDETADGAVRHRFRRARSAM